MRTLEAIPSRPLWVHWLAIVATCFAVYTANFRELGLTDTLPATLLPASLLRDGDLALDEFGPMFFELSSDGATTIWAQLEWTSGIRRVKGKLRSSYPVGAAILAAPVYVAPVALGKLTRFDDYRAVGKVAASLIAALSAGFVFLILLRYCSRGAAVFLTATYALGTSVWVIASQALWQHGPALLCLSVAIWAALRLDENGRARDAALVSIGAGLAVVCRPQDVLAAGAILGYALVRRPRAWAPLVLPGLALGAWQLAYNLSAYGNALGGYPELYRSPAHAWRHLDARSTFTLPAHEGLAGLLVSAGKGAFLYSPILLLTFFTLPIAALPGGVPLARALLVWTIGSLYLLSKNQLWWGGTSYGPRYMTEFSLPLVLGLGMLWPRIARKPWSRLLIAATASVGIAVQALGAFTWECGWHYAPGWIDFVPHRVWDYRDPEILRCAEQLLREGPKRPELGPFARGRTRE